MPLLAEQFLAAVVFDNSKILSLFVWLCGLTASAALAPAAAILWPVTSFHRHQAG